MNENIRIVNIEKDLQSGRKDDQFSLNFTFCVLYQVQTTELPQAPEREVKSGVGGSRHSFSLLSECSVSHVIMSPPPNIKNSPRKPCENLETFALLSCC